MAERFFSQTGLIHDGVVRPEVFLVDTSSKLEFDDISRFGLLNFDLRVSSSRI